MFDRFFRKLSAVVHHKAAPYAALPISSHDQSAKAEAATALHNFRAAVDEYDFLRQPVLGFGLI